MGLSEDRLHRASGPKALFRHRTRVGSFYIAPCRGGWEVQHGGRSLGAPWPSAEAALEDLVGGGTRLTTVRIDTSALAISASLEHWERLGWVTGQT